MIKVIVESAKTVQMELACPVFFGILAALILCGQYAGSGAGAVYFTAQNRKPAAERQYVAELPAPAPGSFGMKQVFSTSDRRDVILELYREPEGRDKVNRFFAELCPTPEIAEVILANADIYSISPALALALCWEESRLNPLAVNSKNRDESIDRGLFQLNNRSFPRLDQQSFFNPSINAYYAMAHLRHCLNTGGSEIAGLAMYNAGTGRVTASGTPKVTLDYVSRILENRRKIEVQFYSHLRQEEGIFLADDFAAQGQADINFFHKSLPEKNLSDEIAEAHPARFHIPLFAPLAVGR